MNGTGVMAVLDRLTYIPGGAEIQRVRDAVAELIAADEEYDLANARLHDPLLNRTPEEREKNAAAFRAARARRYTALMACQGRDP